MKILIAGYSTRGFVEAAAYSGGKHQLLALDYFGDRDQAYFADNYSLIRDFKGESFTPQEVLKASRQLDFEAVAFASGLEHTPEIVEAIAQGKLLVGNNPHTLRQLRDSKRLYRLLEAKGIPFPRVLFPGQLIPEGKWLLKKLGKEGGRGIWPALKGEKVPQGFIGQEYREGCPASVAFAADGYRTSILGYSEQLCGQKGFGAEDFWYSGNLIPLSHPGLKAETRVRIQKMVTVLTKEYGLKGLNGIDFLLLPQGQILFLEINPRYCASMELYWLAYGIDIFQLHLEGSLGTLPSENFLANEKRQDKKYWGKAIVYAREDIRTGDTSGWFEQGVRDIPSDGQYLPQGSPLCSVFARASSRADCFTQLYRQQAYVLSRVIPVHTKM